MGRGSAAGGETWPWLLLSKDSEIEKERQRKKNCCSKGRTNETSHSMHWEGEAEMQK